MRIPFFRRLAIGDWPLVAISFLLAWTESIISLITYILPISLLQGFTRLTQLIYQFTSNPIRLIQQTTEEQFKYNFLNEGIDTETKRRKYDLMIGLLNASNIQEMCQLFGYDIESRVVRTKDDYFLTIQRITKPGASVKRNGRVIYLHHGLLMNCEIWVTMLEKYKNLPFVLYDLGFDVWLGNNRGNKYSQKHLSYSLSSEDFWNFSLDEFAIYDIPNSIDYILETSGKSKLTYIGFSQGSAQAFASVSINPKLNDKIDKLIAISPATTPHGLYSNFLDILLKSSPNVIFLLLSRKVLMPSVLFWKRIMYPPLYDSVIDYANYLLFNWKSTNISKMQKISSYAHLYSTTSVKTIVHWFQIIGHKNFQMFHDLNPISSLNPMSYPLKNIKIPIHLIYGTIDSLVDIDVMKSQLPEEYTITQPIPDHEHLDNIWGNDVEVIFSYVLQYLGYTKNLLSIEDHKNLYLLPIEEQVYENVPVDTLTADEVLHRKPSTGGSVFI